MVHARVDGKDRVHVGGMVFQFDSQAEAQMFRDHCRNATNVTEEEKEIHWLTVGYISPDAEKAICAEGGSVSRIEWPKLCLVGLSYNPEGYWSISHGQRQRRAPVEVWNSGEIQMENIVLQWGPRAPEAYSATETYLILPDEEWDAEAKQVKAKQSEPVQTPPSSDDFDPFLDSDELP